MLKDSLFSIDNQAIQENQFLYNVTIHADHEVFKGHFAHEPILPGVCQIQMIKELLNMQYQKSFKIRESRSIKYLKPINPTRTSKLSVEIKIVNFDSASKKIKFKGRIFFENDVYMKIDAIVE